MYGTSYINGWCTHIHSFFLNIPCYENERFSHYISESNSECRHFSLHMYPCVCICCQICLPNLGLNLRACETLNDSSIRLDTKTMTMLKGS